MCVEIMEERGEAKERYEDKHRAACGEKRFTDRFSELHEKKSSDKRKKNIKLNKSIFFRVFMSRFID